MLFRFVIILFYVNVRAILVFLDGCNSICHPLCERYRLAIQQTL